MHKIELNQAFVVEMAIMTETDVKVRIDGIWVRLAPPDADKETWKYAWDRATDTAIDVAEKWLKTDHITLHAGEMTAQELRSIKAVVTVIIAEIKAP